MNNRTPPRRSAQTQRPSAQPQRTSARSQYASAAGQRSAQSQHTPGHSARRRRTKAAKLAYARAAVVGLLLTGAIAGSIYGFINHTTADADDTRRPANSQSAQVEKPLDGGVDSIASSTVTVLKGDALSTLLDQRLEMLNAVAVDTPPADGSATGTPDKPGEKLEAPTTPTPPQPVDDKFNPATVGGTGQANIAAWKAKNSDVIGWVKIPNTNINYPVVVGPDNLYYGQKGYDKQYSYNGVIWADSDTKFGNRSQISQNTVLYGHNWTNYTANPYIGRASDVMFGQLTSFHHLSFAKRTPYIHYSTENESMTWKVFAAFYTEESFNYIVSDPGTAGLQNIINEAKARSLHNYSVDVDASTDKILTLSTCTRAFGQTSKQRFVVMARLMRPGESITEVEITANPNYKRPQL